MEEDKTLEETFNDYWEEKQGDKTISIATLLSQQLYKRLIELECQAAAFDLSQTNSVNQGNNNSKETNQESLIQPLNSLMIDQELFIGDIKLPEFHGNPSEFGPFWELFQELVHKQPFSNIRKLSILLSCCKGDAARCLQMIPRTADSYEKAIEQLKDQYEDPRRITIQMIRQLTSMKPCNNDPRSLRNNLNDIKAIIATLQKQGEMVDNSYMVTLVTETFSKPIQEEIASKQFDSGCQWTMEDLLVNLTTIIKRREFIESRNENPNEEHSVFHTRTRDQRVPYCIGCERAHAFENCDKYRTIPQMIGRLKSLGACWKCFDSRHKTKYCHMPDCANCGGHHNPILCQRESAKSHSTFQPPFQVTKLRQQLDEQTEQTWTLYESSIQAIATMEEDKTLEETFNDYWEEKQGDKTISITTLLSQQLYKRLIELECQAAAFDLSQINSVNQGNNDSKETNQESLTKPLNSLMIDQELFIGDIKLPEFHGNPSEFGPFWKLFQELVHKQPFSNIRKLSILLSCCKGDAARCLQMIPRTADSYEKAIEQLKDQYKDPRRITIQMIRQLTSMKPCNNDPRSLRNNLSDIKAIIATLKKQGEMVDKTYVVTLVTETFSKPIKEEIASTQQFDSGYKWTMEDLLVNLTTIIKRREFIKSRIESPNEEHSVFHTRTRDQRVPYCIGPPSITSSDQSFISSSLLERLHLIPRSEISITVNTFGGHAEKKHVKRVEALLLNLQEQFLEVILLTTDTISHAIPLLELDEGDKFFLKCNFPNLQEKWLHDTTTEIIPDILLGIDYFNIMLRTSEPLVQLPSGLHLTPTFFGHIICGAPHNKNTKMKLLSNKVNNVNPTECTNINHSQCTDYQPNFGYSNLRKLPNADNEVLHTNDEPTKVLY
ncbi:hypothetical protein OSTOST_01057 [Ostertagia ostertagi]